jgi:lipopolysaccharide/colanic/teichoic acid biosynthesis glycosyltransferase
VLNDTTQSKISDHPEFFKGGAGYKANKIYAAAKRFCELCIVIAVAPPVLLTIALAVLAVLWTIGRPVFVTRECVGKGGRIFRQLKLRARMENNTSEVARMAFIGRFLEDSRLAELPLLWNVLVGDMSFVGPRPESAHEAKLYRERLPNYELRQSVRPGITGLAQVYLRSASPSTTLNYDLHYIRHMGAALDLKILWNNVFPGNSYHTHV